MTKVVYIDQTGQLGGGELSLLDYLSAVRRNTHVVLFEDGPFRERLEEIGETVEIVPTGLLSIRRRSGFGAALRLLPAFWKGRAALRRALRGADVLYANSQKAFLLTALAASRDQQIIWHLRDLLTREHFSRLLIRAAVLMGNLRAAAIIVNSQATADAFIEAGGDRAKIHLVPDGIDPSPFDAVDSDTSLQLRDGMATRDVFLIGLFGRFANWKGQHVLLEAISTLEDVQVCLVGDALFGETEYAAKIRARASQPDLAGRVHFLGFRKDVPELMGAMDLVTHTSVSAEPLGRVIIEAMMARKPVIATRAGGAGEILEDGVSGVYVAPGSVEELRAAILLLRNDPDRRQALAAGGRIRAESLYSLESMVKRTDDVVIAL